MSNYIAIRDGGKSSEEGLMKPWYRLFSSGVPISFNSTSLKATQRGAGANMSVDVAIGDVALADTNYVFWGWSDAVNNVSIGAADPTNPRIDIVVAYLDKAVVSSASNNNPGALKFVSVAGTAAPSPTAPSDGTIQSAVGASNPFVKLAQVSVAALASSIVNANITDIRSDISYRGSVATSSWSNLNQVPTTVTYGGARTYTLVFNGVDLTSVLSAGMRIRSTRNSNAPNQCTSLNGTTQYWVKTSPNKLTFTDDFVVSAWIKLSAYPSSAATIASRYNGTSGWIFYVTASGLLILQGFNAGAGNFSYVIGQEQIPLNKWIHVAAQLDMSTFTATTTTSYVMHDGVDIAATVVRAGTNPTALLQAGNLEIGAYNSGTAGSFFAGKLAQVAIFNAKVTQATMLGYISQGLSGSETSLASAYSLSNSTSDLNTTTPNDLSAGAGSPTTTNADSPFGGQGNGNISQVYDYAVIGTVVFSTNTTVTVMVPEGNALTTSSGGVAAIHYSSTQNPVGFRGSIAYPYGSVKSVTNNSGPTLTNTDQDLASCGLRQVVSSPIACTILVTVSLGITSTTDYEFQPTVRVDGVNYFKMAPSAALGSAGGRANVRGFTYAVPIAAGTHVISAGVELSSATTPVMTVTGGTLSIAMPAELVY